MKTKKQLSILLWLLVILFLVSCSKKETLAPIQDQVISNKKEVPELINSPTLYNMLTQMPSFMGGDSLFRLYLHNKINYPQEAIDHNISGKIITSFIVETDGSISNLKVLRGIGYGCDDAVLNTLGNMPSWSPGRINDNTVRVQIILPLEFKKTN
jgi:TonB family protein